MVLRAPSSTRAVASLTAVNSISFTLPSHVVDVNLPRSVSLLYFATKNSPVHKPLHPQHRTPFILVLGCFFLQFFYHATSNGCYAVHKKESLFETALIDKDSSAFRTRHQQLANVFKHAWELTREQMVRTQLIQAASHWQSMRINAFSAPQ